MRNRAQRWPIGAWALIAAVLLLSALNVRSVFLRWRTLAPPDGRVADWAEYAALGQRIGPPTALVTIVEFSDYQCGACRQFQQALDPLRTQYGDKLAIVIRHLPLPSSSEAVPAARSAVCAGRQGRFEQLHSQMLSIQDSLGSIPWGILAGRVGVVDTSTFMRCLEDETTDAALREDLAAAERLGTLLTPTLLINDRLYRGMPSDLDRIIAEVMEDAREARASISASGMSAY